MASMESAAGVGLNARTRLPFGVLAYTGAGVSITICFAKAILTYSYAVIGLGVSQINLNPHIQAVLMWLFALGAIVGLSLDRNRCGSSLPTILGVVGFVIIVGTLYGYYRTDVLMMGYTVLLAAAFLNQAFHLRQLNLRVARQAESLHSLNATLEQRVEEQVREIESLGRLKRFLAPAVAELLVTRDGESRLDSHRRYIAVLFCDIRGFTSFTEAKEPEEVMAVLGKYHECMGRLAVEYEATIDHRAGDGLMLFFNDPIPCDAPELKAARLALKMRNEFDCMNERWQKLGYRLGFGVGIASGYATMGVVGFEGRYDYTANGSAVNLAARLCDHAEDGQILIDRRTLVEVEGCVEARPIEGLELKGVSGPVVAYELVSAADSEHPP